MSPNIPECKKLTQETIIPGILPFMKGVKWTNKGLWLRSDLFTLWDHPWYWYFWNVLYHQFKLWHIRKIISRPLYIRRVTKRVEKGAERRWNLTLRNSYVTVEPSTAYYVLNQFFKNLFQILTSKFQRFTSIFTHFHIPTVQACVGISTCTVTANFYTHQNQSAVWRTFPWYDSNYVGGAKIAMPSTKTTEYLPFQCIVICSLLVVNASENQSCLLLSFVFL